MTAGAVLGVPLIFPAEAPGRPLPVDDERRPWHRSSPARPGSRAYRVAGWPGYSGRCSRWRADRPHPAADLFRRPVPDDRFRGKFRETTQDQMAFRGGGDLAGDHHDRRPPFGGCFSVRLPVGGGSDLRTASSSHQQAPHRRRFCEWPWEGGLGSFALRVGSAGTLDNLQQAAPVDRNAVGLRSVL